MKTCTHFCVALILAFVCLCPKARAQDLDQGMKALTMINDFAERWCKSPELKGRSASISVEGKAKLEASKLVKQLADLNVGGAAKYTTSDYEGLLQKDLLAALQNDAKCKEKLYDDLKDRFLPPKRQQRSDSGDTPAREATNRQSSKSVSATTPPEDATTIFGLRFSDDECTISRASRISCSFTVTNINATTELGFQFTACCRAIDQRGNGAPIVHATIANTEGSFTRQVGYVHAPLEQDVPTRVTITFLELPTGVTKVTALHLRIKLAGTFRDIALRDIPTRSL